MGLSGPEVIETANGVEEFDSRDRALVWRTVGGKHRYLIGDCDRLVDDEIAEFRAAFIALMREAEAFTLEAVEHEHAMLTRRIELFGGHTDALDVWRALGWEEPEPGFRARHEGICTARGGPARSGSGDGPMTTWRSVADALFPAGHRIEEKGDLLYGEGRSGDKVFAVIGTTNHAEVGVELALAMAAGVLDTVRTHPGRPLLFLIDTKGQRLRHRDELLGINSFMAHLGRCVEIARQRGHRILGLIYDQALSGGFIPNAMMADLCAALPGAEIRVMGLPAMARIMRIPEEKLRALSETSPVFAPGAIQLSAHGRDRCAVER